LEPEPELEPHKNDAVPPTLYIVMAANSKQTEIIANELSLVDSRKLGAKTTEKSEKDQTCCLDRALDSNLTLPSLQPGVAHWP
jgi:hypothetical protein